MARFKPRRQIIAEIKERKEKQEYALQKVKKVRETLTRQLTYLSSFLHTQNKIKKHLQNIFSLLPNASYHYSAFKVNATKIYKEVQSNLSLAFSILSKALLNTAHKVIHAIKPFISSVSKNFKHLTVTLGSKTWSLRFPLLSIVVVCLAWLNICNLNMRFPDQPLKSAIKAVNAWPTLPSSSLLMVKAAFNNGYQDLATTYLTYATSQVKQLEAFCLNIPYSSQLREVKEHIETPQKLRTELQAVEKDIDKAPYSWQLLLRKAKLEAELYQQKELEKTLALITWLYPQFPLPLKQELESK